MQTTKYVFIVLALLTVLITVYVVTNSSVPQQPQIDVVPTTIQRTPVGAVVVDQSPTPTMEPIAPTSMAVIVTPTPETTEEPITTPVITITP